jgi:hypothetical protein
VSTPEGRILVIEAQIKRLETDRAYDNAAGERSEDRIYLRFDGIEKRLHHLELKIAYAAGGIMLLQSLISIAIRMFWPSHA